MSYLSTQGFLGREETSTFSSCLSQRHREKNAMSILRLNSQISPKKVLMDFFWTMYNAILPIT